MCEEEEGEEEEEEGRGSDRAHLRGHKVGASERGDGVRAASAPFARPIPVPKSSLIRRIAFKGSVAISVESLAGSAPINGSFSLSSKPPLKSCFALEIHPADNDHVHRRLLLLLKRL
ncbi:hypothetical protein TTRE_0000023801 [Trichuris trichiura]|uniref:Uncharacterized protein n=1 Tax=Trichuris trichiura TaxID=36087 RepID=A0A077YW51_TRITR|nr:hypothetical protein TTRE_0000023801 [Trichuris trichiura]